MLVGTQLVGFGSASLTPAPVFYNSAQSGTHQITVPASSPAGSFAVLAETARGTSGIPSAVNTSGWTTDANETGTNTRLMLKHRILDADDESDVLTGMNGDSADEKLLLVFSGPFNTATLQGFQSESTAGNAAAQTQTIVGARRPLIVFGLCQVHNLTAAFSTASPAFDDEIFTSTDDLVVGYKIYDRSEALANHTIDMDDIGTTQWLASWYFELT